MKTPSKAEIEKSKHHYEWKGEDAGYDAKHNWIKKYYGKADHCEFDKDHIGTFDWANVSGKYHREVEDYIQLCRSCHRKFDKGNYCKYGHEFTIENTYIDPDGNRNCKICSRRRTNLNRPKRRQKDLDYQRAYRLKMREEGRCRECGEKAVTTYYCEYHRNKYNLADRQRRFKDSIIEKIVK